MVPQAPSARPGWTLRRARRILATGATSRRTSVAGTHAVDLVEAKGLRLEVVGSCLATAGGTGAWVRAGGRSGDHTTMTTDKARKRAVRARMQKTGERYAAARRHVVPWRRHALRAARRHASPNPACPSAAITKGTRSRLGRLVPDPRRLGRDVPHPH